VERLALAFRKNATAENAGLLCAAKLHRNLAQVVVKLLVWVSKGLRHMLG